MTTYITRQDDMLDAICLAHYGNHHSATLAQVLEANRALAWQPPILPAGLPILLPSLVAATPAAPVKLWD